MNQLNLSSVVELATVRHRSGSSDCSVGTGLADDLENVDLAVAGGSGQCIDGHALDPFDALVERAALQDPEATNDFLGLGEWAVDDLGGAAMESDPRAFRAWLETLGCEPDARADQILVVRVHLFRDPCV